MQFLNQHTHVVQMILFLSKKILLCPLVFICRRTSNLNDLFDSKNDLLSMLITCFEAIKKFPGILLTSVTVDSTKSTPTNSLWFNRVFTQTNSIMIVFGKICKEKPYSALRKVSVISVITSDEYDRDRQKKTRRSKAQIKLSNCSSIKFCFCSFSP
jgi:hypothetical protein